MPTVSQYRADVDELVRLALVDLQVLWRQVSDDVEAQRLLSTILPELTAVYGSAAAALAADWYDDLREEAEITGRFRAVAADLPTPGRFDALAGWAIVPITAATPDFPAALERANGGMQRIIADAGRGTVTGSSVSDPGARGWQRTGSGECTFCQMLIDRGAVYTAATVDFGSHDHCRCSAVPAWEGQPRPVKPYTGTARTITDADRARTLTWMREHGY